MRAKRRASRVVGRHMKSCSPWLISTIGVLCLFPVTLPLSSNKGVEIPVPAPVNQNQRESFPFTCANRFPSFAADQTGEIAIRLNGTPYKCLVRYSISACIHTFYSTVTYSTMRFTNLSALFFALAAGQASAVVLDQIPYDYQCGIMSKYNPNSKVGGR
jgi:hypothetical protein